MSVYVDKESNPFGRMVMCHMMADTLKELFEMSDKIGMRRQWFQPRSFPHFDLSKSRRSMAVNLGAIEMDRRETVDLMNRVRADWDSFFIGFSKEEIERLAK